MYLLKILDLVGQGSGYRSRVSNHYKLSVLTFSLSLKYLLSVLPFIFQQTQNTSTLLTIIKISKSYYLHSLANFKGPNSISMAPYKAFYGRKCRTPLCWDKVSERKLKDVELIEATLEKVKIIRERLKATQDQQKSYVDTRRRDLEFEVGDMIFIKVAHWKEVIRFQK